MVGSRFYRRTISRAIVHWCDRITLSIFSRFEHQIKIRNTNKTTFLIRNRL